MRPLDPRLLRTADAVRWHLAATVLSGAATTGLVLAQAWLLAHVISAVAAGRPATDVAPAVAAVAAVAVARALLGYAAETLALRSAARAKSQLRRRLVAHVTGAGHGLTALTAGPAPPAGEVATLATRGLDALDDYFARYLPQLVLAVLVPVAVLVVVAGADWLSAVVIAVTLPLIPVFMALVGWHTQAMTRRRWHLLNRLGGHFLDVVEGLPTLAVFRRAKAQAATIRRVSDAHRGATMRTLRVAFLSALVLELLATIAVALVAVEVGLRLMYGMLDYQTALLVLILAPEAYLPLREVGARFHASMEGVAAAEQVFATLERGGTAGAGATHAATGGARDGTNTPVGTAPPDGHARAPGGAAPANGRARTARGTAPPHDGARAAASSEPSLDHPPALRLERVGLTYPDRTEPALWDLTLTVPAGRRLLLHGPSGCGKSSLLALLLRFAEPSGGRILVGGPDGAEVDLARLPPEEWRSRLAWVPQRPYLFDMTVAENIALGAPDAPPEAIHHAAELAEADGFVRALPDGYQTRLGERGTRLSAGQRQRVALARAFLRDAPLVLLDEPTAHLDPGNAATVRRAVRRLLTGRTAIVVAHDPGWVEAGTVDRAVEMAAGDIHTGATP